MGSLARVGDPPLFHFPSLSWAAGKNVSPRGGSFPLGLLEKGDEGADLVDSSLMEKKKKKERPVVVVLAIVHRHS